MRGPLQFVNLLRQYGKAELTAPLGAFARIADLPEDAPEHVVYQQVVRFAAEAARAFWRFLQDLPAAVNAPATASFVIGHVPLMPRAHADLERWDQWLERLYAMAMEREPVKAG